jgi:DNA-binding response OmpR family regulator
MLSEQSLVLVVEDEYFILADLEQTLTDAGFAVHSAYSGEDALKRFIGDTVYRALVTDVNLRGRVSGWDLARRIREREPGFPIVYVSCAPGNEWASQGVPNSILISKPFGRARVVAAVANLLNIGMPPKA